MAKGLTKSRIGYTGIGSDGKPVMWYYGWAPGGMGCSGGCEGCWARALAARFSACPDCRAFNVHLHPERLDQPANTRRPGVVLVNFTCDTFDRLRPTRDIGSILWATGDAPRHTYVFLTKNADRMAEWPGLAGKEGWWYLGLTIRTQAEADAKLPVFLTIPGNLWISNEPNEGPLNFNTIPGLPPCSSECRGSDRCNGRRPDNGNTRFECEQRAMGDSRRLKGVIVGHNNTYGAPGTDTLDHIRSVVEQCKAANIRCYVKQIFMHKCPVCGQHYLREGDCCCTMGGPRPRTRPRLLRASHPDEYALYPPDLQLRELPWSGAGGRP